MKIFFLKWEISRSKSQFEKKNLKKLPFFLRLEAEFFLAHDITQDICVECGGLFNLGDVRWRSWVTCGIKHLINICS